MKKEDKVIKNLNNLKQQKILELEEKRKKDNTLKEKKIKKIAVVGKENSLTFPCGVCRQVIREFCTIDCEIIVIKKV